MEKIRLGIIGIGNMGSSHAKSVLGGECPDFELTAAADLKPERLQWATTELSPDIHCFQKAEEMLDSGLIDACMVCVPHYDHPKYAIACLRRGIHVMVEKPAGVYTKHLDPFGGSGSTLIACEQTDRIARTIELDEKFCDVIIKRYIEQVGKSDGVSVMRDGVTFQYSEVTANEE